MHTNPFLRHNFEVSWQLSAWESATQQARAPQTARGNKPTSSRNPNGSTGRSSKAANQQETSVNPKQRATASYHADKIQDRARAGQSGNGREGRGGTVNGGRLPGEGISGTGGLTKDDIGGGLGLGAAGRTPSTGRPAGEARAVVAVTAQASSNGSGEGATVTAASSSASAAVPSDGALGTLLQATGVCEDVRGRGLGLGDAGRTASTGRTTAGNVGMTRAVKGTSSVRGELLVAAAGVGDVGESAGSEGAGVITPAVATAIVTTELPGVSGAGSSVTSRTTRAGLHVPGDIVGGGRYKIVSVLGQGGMGVMFEAEDLQGTVAGGRREEEDSLANGSGNSASGLTQMAGEGNRVAIKCTSLRTMTKWKDMEMFEREARVLRSLSHPGIPQYLDYFEEDTSDDLRLYQVRRIAPGSSLAQLVAAGWRATEAEIVSVAKQVLEVLAYLESLRPPVVHRDIKPENIILDVTTGKLQVVDFGAVQDRARGEATFASTVVGTFGYMAPEQFQDRASSQSDLYSLGATLLLLLSGRPPSTFPQTRLKVNFSSLLSDGLVSPQLARILDKLLEPAPEDRFKSASQVLKALDNPNSWQREQQRQEQRQQSNPKPQGVLGGNQFRRSSPSPSSYPPSALSRNAASKAQQLGRAAGRAVVGPAGQFIVGSSTMVMPPFLSQGDGDGLTPAMTFSGSWEELLEQKPAGSNVMVQPTEDGSSLVIHLPPTGVTAETVGTGTFAIAWNSFLVFWTAAALTGGAPILFAAFSIPFWAVGAQLAGRTVGSAAVSVDIELTRSDFSVTWRLGSLWSTAVRGRRSDITETGVVVEGIQNGEPMESVQLVEGVKEHRFGGGLKPVERRWLSAVIASFLGLPSSYVQKTRKARAPSYDSSDDESDWQ